VSQQASSPEKDAPVPTHPPGFRIRRGQNWFLLGLTYASYYMCRYNISVASTRLIDAFGFSNLQYGLINTARHWCYAAGQFLNGLITDRLGGKQAMALGAALTIVLNLAFAGAAYTHGWLGVSGLLVVFTVIRGLDGYSQAFGAPGMIKVNTAWFPRSERGRFAGIFGMMIQFGQITIFTLGPLLLLNHTFQIGSTVFHYRGDWRNLFLIPPIAVAVITTVMFLVVKNNPEEAGYEVRHAEDEEHADADHEAKIPLRVVFATIARKPMVWLTAAAYFCTGVVRTAQYDWWVVYFDREWGLDIATSTLVIVTGALLPVTGIVGSLGSGLISDMLFKGKRAPVAFGLYAIETGVILTSALVLSNPGIASAKLAAVMTLLISLTCNSTHSILGTAAAMDLGGRKMAGFASGVIDSFQYIGAGFAGIGFGLLVDRADLIGQLGWSVWYWFMLPFSAFGMLLMAYVWRTTRGQKVTAA
jgi:OPA family glycerol-3-phosphate transporter-like MFS transporter